MRINELGRGDEVEGEFPGRFPESSGRRSEEVFRERFEIPPLLGLFDFPAQVDPVILREPGSLPPEPAITKSVLISLGFI